MKQIDEAASKGMAQVYIAHRLTVDLMTENKPALIIVDMINDYVHPDGELYGETLHDVVPTIDRLITVFHDLNLPVVYANTSVVSDEQPMVKKWGVHAERGTWGAKVVEEIAPSESDYVVRKPMYDGFYDTELDHILRSLDVTEVVLTGVDSHVCVLQTGIGAANRNYDVTVAEDGMSTKEQHKHEFAINYTESHLGRVMDHQDLVSYLK
jgi:nicotinamidase-related amidase